MNIAGCVDPGSHPSPDSTEQMAYADLQADGVNTSDVDWSANDFDRIAEQTLGAQLAF